MGKRNKGANTELPTAPEAALVTEQQATNEAEVEAKAAAFDALQQRRTELLAELATVEGTLAAEYRNWTLMTSVVVKPVQLCREVFITMAAELGVRPGRAAVLKACTDKGVAPNTAKTQYQINSQRYQQGQFDELIEELVGELVAA
jgi:hypothetical protein